MVASETRRRAPFRIPSCSAIALFVCSSDPRAALSYWRLAQHIATLQVSLTKLGRGFWLRLDREAKAVDFKASNIFPSFYFFSDPKEAGERLALITTYVDDLLIAQTEKGKAAVERLLNKFEMGSLEHSSFRYCGKQFVQNEKEVSIDVSDMNFSQGVPCQYGEKQ